MVTKEDVERYAEIDERRKRLSREVDSLQREQKALDAKLREHVKAKGGSDRTTVFHGYILALKTAAGSVAWKTEFIKECGQEAADKLSADCPRREVLQVEKSVAA